LTDYPIGGCHINCFIAGNPRIHFHADYHIQTKEVIMKEWLVKVKHYRGGESVITDFDDKGEAQEHVDYLNGNYQSDNYYVERNRNFK
jgi:hypothetical protein